MFSRLLSFPSLRLLLLALLINFCLYTLMAYWHPLVPFNQGNYYSNAHHYLADTRTVGHGFQLLSALGQYDAQWYLKIASVGYTSDFQSVKTKDFMGRLSYAFFPLYPLLLHLLNLPLGNLEITAFILSNLLYFTLIISGYYTLARIFSPSLASKSLLLLILFPFSIFLRSYFAEGLQLLLLIWFAYFFHSQRLILAALVLGLLNITKGNTLLLSPILLYYLWRSSLSFSQKAASFFLLTFPFSVWIGFCYLTTGRPLAFLESLALWIPYRGQVPMWFYNFAGLFNFWRFPFHSFHFSQVESVVFLSTTLLLTFSFRSRLPKKFWLISFVIGLTPFITKDLMSYSRYQSVSFPLFVYLAHILHPKAYRFLLGFFALSLGFISLFFINWFWIG